VLKMAVAFVLINVDMGTIPEVLNELSRIEAVKEAYSVYGVYDIIVRIESEDMDKLRNTIQENIRGVKRVRTTLTAIVVD
jgi:DNA-binding Lrp family transcriptional regulator